MREEILDGKQGLDRNRFREIYKRHQKPLVAYATAMLAGDVAAGEDVVDEAFTDIWKGGKGSDHKEKEAFWIRRIVRNKAVDWLRKFGDTKIDVQTATENLDSSSSGDFDEFSSRLSDSEWLKRALSNLALDHREVILLFYYQEMSLIEIAEFLGCPKNTVKSRLHYARKAMAKQHLTLAA